MHTAGNDFVFILEIVCVTCFILTIIIYQQLVLCNFFDHLYQQEIMSEQSEPLSGVVYG